MGQFRGHQLNYHAQSFTVGITTVSGSIKAVVVHQKNGAFQCPICGIFLTTKSRCRSHLKGRICQPDPSLPAITMPKEMAIPALHQQQETHTYDDAVLCSCGMLQASAEEKRRTLGIIEALGLQPILLKDARGAEHYALVHPTAFSGFPTDPAAEPNPVVPQKRRLEDDTSRPTPELKRLLSSSPYAGLLATREYIELDDEICKLLNQNWRSSTHLRFSSAVILSGCIILNSKSGHAIIANAVEMYGRESTVDIHHNSFGLRSGQSMTTPPPAATKTPYKKVRPVTLSTLDGGSRLIIETTSFNALITSSLRLDKVVKPSIGVSTPSFKLINKGDVLATRIYLDARNLQTGLKMAGNRDTWNVSNSNVLCQLRQVKTKFFDASTYYLCRGSSHFTRFHPYQPYTIFSLASCEQFECGDNVEASNLFHNIASNVIKDGAQAVLEKKTVQQLRSRCTDQGSIPNEFDRILSLYGDDDDSMPILDNHDLNDPLESLASHLSPFIATANKEVVCLIEGEFAQPIA
ncbi:hypothetical protein BGW38_000073 [Lunasporangiospora selenospora]|uniref:Uncharacterized protein n=1 Tax=Lunasporangiospora selenospora TaxID=979761 RepID=A0A9P6KF39_9FUNG|nr:hypothetical protein BGW38_000073 [Lunasporangiospora selenospora]